MIKIKTKIHIIKHLQAFESNGSSLCCGGVVPVKGINIEFWDNAVVSSMNGTVVTFPFSRSSKLLPLWPYNPESGWS